MGSRKTHEGVERVYEMAELWVERALRRDDSLFTPGKPIWTRELLGELRERFLDGPSYPEGSFLEKLEKMLAGSPPNVYQLIAEALYVHFLVIVPNQMKVGTKEDSLNKILGWSPMPVKVPQHLVQALEPGIGGTGVQFLLGRPYHLGFLIEFAEGWKSLGTAEPELILRDPWKFKKFVFDMNLRSDWLRDAGPDVFTMQREALFHLIFPDTFERVFPVYQKELIAESFADLVAESTEDVDRKLQQIRKGIEVVYNRDFDFYDSDILDRWDPTVQPWAAYIQRAKAYLATGKLEEQEISYKVEIAKNLKVARQAVLDGSDDWADLLKQAPSNQQSQLRLLEYNQQSE